MSKILFYSDTHIRDYGSFPPFNKVEDNGFTRELNNIIDGFAFVADEIKRVKPALVFLAGDLYHTPEGLTTTEIQASHVALSMVLEACEKVKAVHVAMPGNHDCYSDKLGIYSISTLGAYGRVITQNEVLTVGTDKFRVGVVQYNSDKGLMIKSMEEMRDKHGVKLIITHADVEGVTYETGVKSHSTIPSKWSIPVISGDIHFQQDVGDVHYIGSLVQNKFNRSDLDGAGGTLVFDTKTKKITRSVNTFSKHYIRITQSSQIPKLNPLGVVLQVKLPKLDDQTLDFLKDFEYVHIPVPESKTESSEGVKTLQINDSPISALRRFTANNRPSAVRIINEVLSNVE